MTALPTTLERAGLVRRRLLLEYLTVRDERGAWEGEEDDEA